MIGAYLELLVDKAELRYLAVYIADGPDPTIAMDSCFALFLLLLPVVDSCLVPVAFLLFVFVFNEE